jgi:8-hydroxy-5-deazaflavin:NADPH oxidoreductase
MIADRWRRSRSSTALARPPARRSTKQQARGLLHDLGWSDDEIVDLGGIETARGPEHYLVLFAKLAGLLRTEAFNIRVVR